MENNNPRRLNSRAETLLLAFLAFLLVFLLWQGSYNSSLLYPFRLLVTFVHESGHGITAIVTGGRFVDFTVDASGSGVARTIGGSVVLVKSMGYLGAALFGAALLFAANRVPRVRIVAAVIGVFFLLCAILYTGGGMLALIGAAVGVISWLLATRVKATTMLRLFSIVVFIAMIVLVHSNIALMIGLVAGMLLLALAVFGSRRVILFALNALAFMIGFNAFDDLQYLLSHQAAGVGDTANDALALATATHTPELLWIVLWIAIALLLMGLAIYYGLLRPERKIVASSERLVQ